MARLQLSLLRAVTAAAAVADASGDLVGHQHWDLKCFCQIF